MRFSIAFVLLAICAAAVKSDEDNMTMLLRIVGECKEKTGASQDDIKTLVMGENPETKEAKCMFSCVMETMEIVRIYFI
jgi:hypothetical protein